MLAVIATDFSAGEVVQGALIVIFAFTIIIMVIVFLLVGLITSLSWLFRRPADRSHRGGEVSTPVISHRPNRPSLKQDVLASRRLIDHLLTTEQITRQTHGQLQRFLEQKFATFLGPLPSKTEPAQKSIPQQKTAKQDVQPPSGLPPATKTELPIRDSSQELPIVPVPPLRPTTAAGSISAQPQPAGPEVVTAQVAESTAAPRSPVRPAPWDLPDPPPKQPRRSLAEVMSGFMQEKNMRWGELTSGILIVLSAVGLVLSLRDQLSEAIPYFSAILFMLITGAIIGAGIYTLKKWKLRNTSRGTLVIGLLLVPLNFVSACILSGGEDRRELADPRFWLALAVGLGGFGAMTWWASKYLLRKFNWPLVLGIMGCGAGTILINRMFEWADNSWRILLLTMPLLVSFAVGSAMLGQRQRQQKQVYWSPRATNRALLHLGISTFAILAALSLFLVRSETKLVTVVSVSPVLLLVSLTVSWIGSTVRTSRHPKNSNSSFVGLTLQILGIVLSAIFVVGSLANPTVFMINCLLAAGGLVSIGLYQKTYPLLPVGWSFMSAGILAGFNLFSGRLGHDQWASPAALSEALFNGQSGLCLLFCGILAVSLNVAFARTIQGSSHRKTVWRSGLMTGGCIFLAGCAIAVVSSIVNRNSVFDTMTASSLLMTAGVGSLIASLVQNRHRASAAASTPETFVLPNLAAALLLCGLAHSLLWNPTIGSWFDGLTKNTHANWVCVFVLHGFLTAIVSALYRAGPDLRALLNWSSVTSGLAIVGAVTVAPQQTGVATIVMVVATIAWWLIGWSIANSGSLFGDSSDYAGVSFVLSTAICVVIGVVDLGSRFEWCPIYQYPRHWLIQAIGLSAWAILWTLISVIVYRTKKQQWLVSASPRVDQVILYGLVLVVGGLIAFDLAGGTAVELYADVQPFSLSLADNQVWVWAALAATGLAVLLMILEQPIPVKGAALIILWMSAWAFGAIPFEASRSTASAIRWLLPIGGLVGAVLMSVREPAVPAWALLRNRLKLSGRSLWRRKSTEQLINLALAIVVFAALLISTLTISQVMLNGADSLGGPTAGSWFGKLDKVISFGVPVALVVSAFLVYAISERRCWLATAGSTVFQYLVVLAVVLLFLSPHPQLASSWFVRVLQSISLGMTFYGFAWYLMRNRIDAPVSALPPAIEETQNVRRRWISQIEIHAVINGLLVTSLAILVYIRFFFVPYEHGDWINSVGGWLGILAWGAFAVLAVCVWREQLAKPHSDTGWLWLIGWMGLVMVAMTTAIVDYNFEKQQIAAQWLAYKILSMGTVIVAAVQIVWLTYRSARKAGPDNQRTLSNEGTVSSSRASTMPQELLPVFLTSALGLTFAVRGAWENPGSFWLFLVLVVAVAALIFFFGLQLRRAFPVFVAGGVSLIGTTLVILKTSFFASNQPSWVNLSLAVMAVMALTNLAFYLYRRIGFRESIRTSFVAFPNIVLLLGTIWILLGSLLEYLIRMNSSTGPSSIVNPLGILATLLLLVLLVVSLWSDRRRFWVFAFCASSLGVVIAAIAFLTVEDDSRSIGVLFGAAAVVCSWGIVWVRRSKPLASLRKLRAPSTPELERSLQRQLPVYTLILTGLLVIFSFAGILATETRSLRFLDAFIPFVLACGIGCLSNQGSRRWLQVIALGLITLGCLFFGWADLQPSQMFRPNSLSLLVRSLLVLAGTMFIYGGLVTRWVREGDSWLRSLREMAAVTCGLAIVCLLLVIVQEWGQFREGIGCGLTIAEAVSVAVVVVGMIVGLISIAVRPQRDPFSLSLEGRQAYVYVAQLVAVGLITHLYLSMPWLFRIGIKEYWPYIAMAICFGGVGLAQILEKRNLTVLGQPLFTTAAILPVLTAAAIFQIDSRADGALVMLTVGLAYLLMSYTQRSVLSAAASVVFGNLALWMFYDKFPHFSFLEHPQLWLIPPAVSVLIAGQFNRNSLTSKQLATLRYLSVAVIYVSSTSEIFISGLGDKLWPPMVLALLSVVGIMAGILMQIRSFLYLGSLFLLMAMITMVAHAHRKFDHVWPWWAFGITLGIAILIVFGLFEKKKNEMKAIAGQLKEWEV